MELFAYHNSREKRYRFPQGALRCCEEALLTLRLWGWDAANASCMLRLWADGRESLLQAEKRFENGDVVFDFRIAAPEAPQLIWYHFIVDVCGERLYYGAASGVGVLTHSVVSDYQITVCERDIKTPDWFKRGIVYQIFPDRFNRGERDAEGRTALDRLEYHERLGRRVRRHESWSEPPEHLPAKGEKDYSPMDFFGGDLRGVREKLDYLSSLGVSCIYLNPIFEAASNHRYNTSDYMRIDPVLGDENELRLLVREAKKRGIALMLDGVFSHTGDDSVYFNKYGNYDSLGAYSGPASPYYKWYSFDEFPSSYRCWWGFSTLPEVREEEESYCEFIEKVLEKWAGFGISSWRLDVADELPDSFIERLRTALKRLDPQGVLLGEVWEDASNKTWEKGLRRYVYGHELDSVMNYPFRDALIGFFLGRNGAPELSNALAAQRERYPEPFYRAAMNLLSTHDTERILSALSGAPGRGSLSREEQAEFVLDENALAVGKKRLIAASLVQYVMPQPPCVYYGDEAGMTGLFDPFNRKTFPWGSEDRSLVEHYRLLGRLRSSMPALLEGGAAFCAFGEDIFAVLRGRGEETALMLVNRASDALWVCVRECDFYEGPDAGELSLAGEFSFVFGGSGAVFVERDAGLKVELPPISAVLLVSAKAKKNTKQIGSKKKK